ncbi:tetratricopeptide repeat protein [Bremerella sp.]|uniref:tetratricopeptide repeat protein n=1 Tax=Bremerella sp. TaxID=2795602 RepID=UPI00391B21CA
MSDSPERHPVLLSIFQKYLSEENTAAFIHRVAAVYTCGTLERLSQHGTAEVRRAAVMALCFVSDYSSNHTVGMALNDADRGVRLIAENGIRSLWIRAGTQSQRHRLRKVMTQIQGNSLDSALLEADSLIVDAPWYSEAYNQRGQVYYKRQNFERSLRDSHQALEINPYHFPAAISMGQCYLRQGENVMALDSFRRALRLNPNLESIRTQITYLERQLEEM